MLEMLFTTDAMRTVFADATRVQRMLDFEAALARAEAATGVIPAAVAASVVRCCRAEDYDLAALRAAAREAGNLAIPLVAALTAQVARIDVAARGFVHWGATSQDMIDTGLVLQLRAALDLFGADLARFAAVLALQVRAHRSTPLVGRTWLQQALPVTLGSSSRERSAQSTGIGKESRRCAPALSSSNSAVGPARWRHWEHAAWRWRLRSPQTWGSPSPTHHGIPNATTSAKWPRSWVL